MKREEEQEESQGEQGTCKRCCNWFCSRSICRWFRGIFKKQKIEELKEEQEIDVDCKARNFNTGKDLNTAFARRKLDASKDENERPTAYEPGHRNLDSVLHEVKND